VSVASASRTGSAGGLLRWFRVLVIGVSRGDQPCHRVFRSQLRIDPRRRLNRSRLKIPVVRNVPCKATESLPGTFSYHRALGLPGPSPAYPTIRRAHAAARGGPAGVVSISRTQHLTLSTVAWTHHALIQLSENPHLYIPSTATANKEFRLRRTIPRWQSLPWEQLARDGESDEQPRNEPLERQHFEKPYAPEGAEGSGASRRRAA